MTPRPMMMLANANTTIEAEVLPVLGRVGGGAVSVVGTTFVVVVTAVVVVGASVVVVTVVVVGATHVPTTTVW